MASPIPGTVELAADDAVAQIARMSRDHIEQGLAWGWTDDRVRAALGDADTNVAVVRSGPRVQAFGIMRYRERHAHLLLLAVRPAERRKGLATAIVTWLESVAMAAGSEHIVVECRRSNADARCLYLDLGYHERRIASRMYGDREDGILLEKWLRPRESEGPDA